MDTEYIVFLLGLILVLLCARVGWNKGGASHLRTTLTLIFAVLFALRYWQGTFQTLLPALKMEDGFVAAGSFFLLLIVGVVIGGLVTQIMARTYGCLERNSLDEMVGGVLGFISGCLIFGAVSILMSLIWPASGMAFDAGKFPVRIDRWTTGAYQMVEKNLAGIDPQSPAHTLLPAWQAPPPDVKEPALPLLEWN